MSFQTKPARSSRITKSRRPSGPAALGLKRTTSSPSSATPRKKPSSSTAPPLTHDDDAQLDDTGVIASLADDLTFRDVPQFIEYIQNSMFSPLPEKAGMNSTRIAEVLNFRKNLPPFVTIAHIDALSTSSTRVEREIAEMAQAGVVRRITIPNRGVGAAAVGDGIALVREWHGILRAHPGLTEELKTKYISTMSSHPTTTTIPGPTFTPSELSILVTNGLLTSTSPASSPSSLFTPSLTTLSTSASRHPSGTPAAAYPPSLTHHIHGGTSLASLRTSHSSTFSFSVPNTGTLIKLLVSARTHLLTLLKKNPHAELPLSTLRERWDGGVATYSEQAVGKKLRGEFRGVLPGRTRKWRAFYGVRFEWVVEECVGAGLVEVFETGSVGRGVRVVR